MAKLVDQNKKVHIIPVAFEIDRAVLPVLQMGADKVYLLTGAQEGSIESSEYSKTIRRKLAPKVQQIVIESYGYYDYKSVFAKLAKIGRDEKGNYVFINLSCGGHIATIAGTLAASMYGWVPYYVEPEKYNVDMRNPKGLTSGVKDIFSITTYPIEKPEEGLVKCLSLVSGIETQKSLMEKLSGKGMLKPAVKGKFEKAEYMKFKREYLEPLLEKGWLKKDGSGKRGRLEITDSGKEIVKIFG
jgi:hypothetical protein